MDECAGEIGKERKRKEKKHKIYNYNIERRHAIKKLLEQHLDEADRELPNLLGFLRGRGEREVDNLLHWLAANLLFRRVAQFLQRMIEARSDKIFLL